MKINDWILKSVPLKYFINEWVSVRGLVVLYKDDFDDRMQKYFERNRISYLPGGNLLGDIHNLNIALVGLQEKKLFAENLRQTYIEEFENLLKEAGRNQEEFSIIHLDLEERLVIRNRDILPLFYVLWIPDKPFFERIISGKDSSINQKLKEIQNLKMIKEVKEKFYIKNTTNKSKYKLRTFTLSEKNNSIVRYFIKKIDDRFTVLFISCLKEHYSLNIFESIVHSFLYNERPVLRMEEYFRFNELMNYSVALIEIKENGIWKGIFYRSTPYFFRNEKQKLYKLPDYYDKKKYIHSSLVKTDDKIVIIPAKLNTNIVPRTISENLDKFILDHIMNYYKGKFFILYKDKQ